MDEETLLLIGELKAKIEQLETQITDLTSKLASLESMQQWTRDDISGLFRELQETQEVAAAAVIIAEEAAADPQPEPEAKKDDEPEPGEKLFDDSKVEDKHKEVAKKKRKFTF